MPSVIETAFQAPTHLWIPPHHSTEAGREVAELADSVGMTLDPEDRLCLDAIFAEREDGKWAAIEAAIICARQNLKTHVLKASVLGDLWLFDARLVTWSAHLFTTTQEAFRDLLEIIENNEFLDRRVKNVSRGNGEEGIELFGDRRILFRARTKTGGRGLTGDVVILDEAFALQASEVGSLMPSLRARPNPQIRYASSAGHAGSAILRGIRDNGRSGTEPRLSYIEWCAKPRECAGGDKCDHRYGTPGCAYDNREGWAEANPKLGRRIGIEFCETERKRLPPVEFAREILGWWEDPEESEEGLSVLEWNICADRASKIVDARVYAVAVALDLSWSTIGVAGRREDGRLHLEAVEYRQGTDWVADRLEDILAKRPGRVFVEEKGPRSTVPDDLAAAAIEVETVTPSQLVDGCGQLEDLMKRGAVRHLGQPELDVSVAGGRRRPVGEGWTWARRASTVEISPIVAVTLALWAASQGPDAESVYEDRDMVVL